MSCSRCILLQDSCILLPLSIPPHVEPTKVHPTRGGCDDERQQVKAGFGEGIACTSPGPEAQTQE